MEETFQVNVITDVDNNVSYNITRYSEDGYRGTTIGTVYVDGYDSTEWCVFVGTHQECTEYIKSKKGE